MEYFTPKSQRGLESKKQTISRRAFVLSVAKYGFFGLLISRLTYLQIFKSKDFKFQSDRNRFREIKEIPERGIVYDINNNILASNLQVYKILVYTNEIKNLDEFLFQIGNYVKLDILEVKKYKNQILKQKRTNKYQPLVLDKSLDWKTIARINYNLNSIPYIQPIISYERTYNYSNQFSHIIGYVSEPDKKDLNNISSNLLNTPNLKVGKSGLEKQFDREIAGSPGISVLETDARGRQLKLVSFNKGNSGKNIYTTLDKDIQIEAFKHLNEESGSIVVMSTDGKILCCVSSPSFDANQFTYGMSSLNFDKLNKNPLKPLSNKALSSLYPPGSTLKMIVALSALENNIINSNFKVRCREKVDYHNQTYHCWKEHGHGVVDLKRAIKESCDIYFYEVTRLLGVDRLYETANKFGFGSLVLDNFLEEKKGLFPNSKWKKKALGKPWYLGETIITGIGQGYIQATNLQICKMVAQIANGGYEIKPSFLKNDDYTLNNKIIKNDDHLKIILESMNAATNEIRGTSYASRIRKGDLLFCGKTGTSQVRKITTDQRLRDIKNKDLPWEFRDHSLFTGFGPTNDPKFAISVIIDHGGSGSAKAAPIASKVMQFIFKKYYKNQNV